jgi:ribosomal protein L40E
MICGQCGADNPKQSNFCRKCGTALGVRSLQCSQCGSENLSDAIFCIDCGKRLSGQKPVKGTQRKCGNCGHLNELEALFCVSCGGEMIKKVTRQQRARSTRPASYKTIAVVVGLVLVLGFLVKFAITSVNKERDNTGPLTSAASVKGSLAQVDDAEVIAVAKNFTCACNGCGELPLADCHCDMKNGALEEKTFIREKLNEGLTVKQVIDLVDKKFGHKV